MQQFYRLIHTANNLKAGQNTLMRRIKPASSLGKKRWATLSDILSFFRLQLHRKAWYFQPCCPKWLGAGCQSWCHIIQRMLHWSQSDTWACLLLSYGPFNPLDLFRQKPKALIWATPYPSWQHFLCINYKSLSASGTLLQHIFWTLKFGMRWQIWYFLHQQKYLNACSCSIALQSGLEVQTMNFLKDLVTY